MARRRVTHVLPTREFQGAPWPIYAVAKERLAYANRALATWLECDVDELIGQPCLPATSSEDSSPEAKLVNQLAPPAELFEVEGCRTFRLAVEGRTSRVAHALAWCSDDSPWPTIWVWVSDAEIDAWESAKLDREREAAQLHAQLSTLLAASAKVLPPALVGRSESVLRVREQLEAIIHRPVAALIHGPPGIGREQVVKYWHAETSARTGSEAVGLFRVACPVMDARLLQSSLELFLESLERARRGWLLLIDVERLGTDLQTLLRDVWMERLREMGVVVASTSRVDLLSDVTSFDRELALRLATFSIGLPSLVERRGDIGLMAQHFLEIGNRVGGRLLEGFSEDALDRLATYHWPENVAELEEVVLHAAQGSEGPLVQLHELPELFDYADDAALHPRPTFEPIELDSFLEEIERELLGRALRAARGNKTQVARMLGVSRQRVIRRTAQWGLDLPGGGEGN